MRVFSVGMKDEDILGVYISGMRVFSVGTRDEGIHCWDEGIHCWDEGILDVVTIE